MTTRKCDELKCARCGVTCRTALVNTDLVYYCEECFAEVIKELENEK